VPEALEYYLGLNEDFDMLGMDEGGESDQDDDDDDTDNKKDKKPTEGAEGDQKPECKQQ
jgi:hypothetical protein